MRDRLIGTWKLVSAVREDMAGHRVDQLGPSPTGYINYAPDGRMMALIARSARTKPAGAQPTPPEADALCSAGYGTWSRHDHGYRVILVERWTCTAHPVPVTMSFCRKPSSRRA